MQQSLQVLFDNSKSKRKKIVFADRHGAYHSLKTAERMAKNEAWRIWEYYFGVGGFNKCIIDAQFAVVKTNKK